MAKTPGTYSGGTYDFAVKQLDVSALVGRNIDVYSHQFPGKPLSSKVVAVTEEQLLVESGGHHDTIDNLVNRQEVVIQFPYRGQVIAVKAVVKRTVGGHCSLLLADHATPLTQRRFRRVPMDLTVRMAPYPVIGSRKTSLERLRWLESETINFSGGGVLVKVPSMLSSNVFLLMNIDFDIYEFPSLVLCKVCHCHQYDDRHFQAGVEFVLKGTLEKMFSEVHRKTMPPCLFQYTAMQRAELNKQLIDWDTKRKSSSR